MRGCAVLLSACLLAGCNAPTVQEKEAARAAEVAELQGWDRVFGAPDAAVAAAGQFGFRPTPYAASGKAFASNGGPVMVSGSMAKQPNQVRFAAEGPDAGRIDTIRFDLTIGDAATAEDARKRTAAIVRDYLFQSGLEAEALVPAISQGVAARGELAGTPYTIEPGEDRLAVTFTRTGANAPANSKPQGN